MFAESQKAVKKPSKAVTQTCQKTPDVKPAVSSHIYAVVKNTGPLLYFQITNKYWG